MLYIVGCSYSAEYYWPSLVDIEHVNFSEPGAGNKYIYACVQQIPLTPDDSIIIQFSEVERIDLLLDKDSTFNKILSDVPSIRQRELADCIAWCTAGPRGAWNNNSVGKRHLAPLMREYYSNFNQKFESDAWKAQTYDFVDLSGAHSLFLDIQTMNAWAKENNMIDADGFHLSSAGNELYYKTYIKDFVDNVSLH